MRSKTKLIRVSEEVHLFLTELAKKKDLSINKLLTKKFIKKEVKNDK